jgi:hypothetical protein
MGLVRSKLGVDGTSVVDGLDGELLLALLNSMLAADYLYLFAFVFVFAL